MADRVFEVHGVRVLELDAAGPPIASERDGADVIGAAFEAGARLVAIPAARLQDDFFRLASGLAGAVLQKFVNYQIQVAIVGDLTAHLARSAPLRAFVEESNRGRAVWFVSAPEELETRLLS